MVNQTSLLRRTSYGRTGGNARFLRVAFVASPLTSWEEYHRQPYLGVTGEHFNYILENLPPIHYYLFCENRIPDWKYVTAITFDAKVKNNLPKLKLRDLRDFEEHPDLLYELHKMILKIRSHLKRFQ